MFKLFALLLLAPVIMMFALFFGWLLISLKAGLILAVLAAMPLLGLFLYTLYTIDEISWLDVLTPVPFAVLWSIPMVIFSFGADLFTMPAFIGSALVLSASLALYKMRKIHPAWLIVPAVTFFYEMLPVNIPGPFDDYFAFGGSALYLVFETLMATSRQVVTAEVKTMVQNVADKVMRKPEANNPPPAAAPQPQKVFQGFEEPPYPEPAGLKQVTGRILEAPQDKPPEA